MAFSTLFVDWARNILATLLATILLFFGNTFLFGNTILLFGSTPLPVFGSTPCMLHLGSIQRWNKLPRQVMLNYWIDFQLNEIVFWTPQCQSMDAAKYMEHMPNHTSGDFIKSNRYWKASPKRAIQMNLDCHLDPFQRNIFAKYDLLSSEILPNKLTPLSSQVNVLGGSL